MPRDRSSCLDKHVPLGDDDVLNESDQCVLLRGQRLFDESNYHVAYLSFLRPPRSRLARIQPPFACAVNSSVLGTVFCLVLPFFAGF
jgi:hypothetical protein